MNRWGWAGRCGLEEVALPRGTMRVRHAVECLYTRVSVRRGACFEWRVEDWMFGVRGECLGFESNCRTDWSRRMTVSRWLTVLLSSMRGMSVCWTDEIGGGTRSARRREWSCGTSDAFDSNRWGVVQRCLRLPEELFGSNSVKTCSMSGVEVAVVGTLSGGRISRGVTPGEGRVGVSRSVWTPPPLRFGWNAWEEGWGRGPSSRGSIKLLLPQPNP